VAAMTGTNAVAWTVDSTAAKSTLPLWPAFIFGAMTLLALYVLGAALARWWPFHRLALAPAELLDDCIRRGRDARECIVRERLDCWQAAREAAAWTLRAANLLHEQFHAIADEFLLTTGEEEHHSGQALPCEPSQSSSMSSPKLERGSPARTSTKRKEHWRRSEEIRAPRTGNAPWPNGHLPRTTNRASYDRRSMLS
jgi:hypothetical protein